MPLKNLLKNLGKAGGEAISKPIDSIGNAIDKLSTSKEEKLEFKKEMSQIMTDHSEKTYKDSIQALLNETNGNWLQRSWRPIIMFIFTGVVLLACYTDVQLNDVPEEFWGLLKLGLGGYIGGRSAEKIAKELSANTSFSIFKNKKK